MKRMPFLPLVLLAICSSKGRAEPYSWTALPLNIFVEISEGDAGLVFYQFQNTGELPIWLYTPWPIVPVSAALPDPTDAATPMLVSEDASDGLEIQPGGIFPFQVFLVTDKDGPEQPRDFGLQTWMPDIGPDKLCKIQELNCKISDQLPVGVGIIGSFDVKVDDIPEPTTFLSVGIALSVLLRGGAGGRKAMR